MKKAVFNKLFLEFDGILLDIGLRTYRFYGYRINGDSKIGNKRSLPKELNMAYYYKFEGLALSYGQFMGYPIFQFFSASLADYMIRYKISKKRQKAWYEWLDQFFPKIEGEYYSESFRILLFGDVGEIDTTIFVNLNTPNGKLYAIQNGDIAGISEVIDPIDLADSFVAHVLEYKEDDFDFSPYLKPLATEDTKEIEFVDYKVDLSILYTRGRYIGNKDAILEWLDIVDKIILHKFSQGAENEYIDIEYENRGLNRKKLLLYSEYWNELIDNLERGEKIKKIMVYTNLKKKPFKSCIDMKKGIMYMEIESKYVLTRETYGMKDIMDELIEADIKELIDLKGDVYTTKYIENGDTSKVNINVVEKYR